MNNKGKNTKEKKKKSNALIIIIIVLTVAIILLGSYMIYKSDNSGNVVSGNETNDGSDNNDTNNEEEPPLVVPEGETIDITNTKIAYEIYDKVNAGTKYGFYFDSPVTINDISTERMLNYVINKNFNSVPSCLFERAEDNSIALNTACSASKENVDNYIKDEFKTDRTFTMEETDLSNFDNLTGPTSILLYGNYRLIYSNGTYYFGAIEGSNALEYSVYELVRAEATSTNIYIYDKAITCLGEGSQLSCYTSYDKALLKESIKSCGITEEGINTCYIEGQNELSFDLYADQTFREYKDQLNTYRHTFEKSEDGSYHWVSSEIV